MRFFTLCELTVLYPFRCSAQNVTLTIKAWDRQQCNDHDIDAIELTLFLSETDQKQTFQETGPNGIGVFNFSYHVLNLAMCNKYEECFTEIPSLDSSTGDCESMIESTPPWSWIAVAIVFMLLSTLFFLVIIVLACIVGQKNKDLELLKYQHGNSSDANRKVQVFQLIIYVKSSIGWCHSDLVPPVI